MTQAWNPQILIAAATKARALAYAPYSGFRVGAALAINDGRIFTGVNVENCSYGLTICAERSAIVSAVTQGLKPNELAAIAIVTDAPTTTPPCGACRQVLAEFGNPLTPVYLFNLTSNTTTKIELGALLPHAFIKDNLVKQ